MLLFIFSAILVKQLLKSLEIFLALVIDWLSIRRLEADSSDLFFMFIIPFIVCHTTFRFFLTSQSIVCNKILLSPYCRYKITVYFELFFITLFFVWNFFLAETFVKLILDFNRTGQSRCNPWFSFKLRLWVFDTFIRSMLI